MIKHISSPAISEEILGAYLEGNLSESESQMVENVLEYDDDLDALVDEIAVENLSVLGTDTDSSPSIYDENPCFDMEFELPEVKEPFDLYPGTACFAKCASYCDDMDAAACFEEEPIGIREDVGEDVVVEGEGDEDSVENDLEKNM